MSISSLKNSQPADQAQELSKLSKWPLLLDAEDVQEGGGKGKDDAWTTGNLTADAVSLNAEILYVESKVCSMKNSSHPLA
jgi:hypothetical protein